MLCHTAYSAPAHGESRSSSHDGLGYFNDNCFFYQVLYRTAFGDFNGDGNFYQVLYMAVFDHFNVYCFFCLVPCMLDFGDLTTTASSAWCST